jgi:hypothetical protein
MCPEKMGLQIIEPDYCVIAHESRTMKVIRARGHESAKETRDRIPDMNVRHPARG